MIGLTIGACGADDVAASGEKIRKPRFQMIADTREPQSFPAAQWLPEKWTPAPRKQPAPPDAKPADTRSVTESDQAFIAMTEAMIRLIARYPGLVDKVAQAIELHPGQSRENHFNTMMEAISRSAPFYPGLGLAIVAALEPFC